MKRTLAVCALVLGVTACGGNPFVDEVVETAAEPDADTTTNSTYLTEQGTFLTLNNITYDAANDELIINNIPFDDPNNVYERITTEVFSNGFDAYDSSPAPGTNEIQYFAIFRRSDSGFSQVAAAGTEGYVQFGYGGAGAQRLSSDPTLPSTGIYSYNGEYGAVRTTVDATTGDNTVQFIIGDATLLLDFDDFDDTGAVGGFINNRLVYDNAGVPVDDGTGTGAQLTLDGFISLTDSTVDFTNGTINVSTATEVIGNNQITGNWSGVLAGPNGEEIAGIVFVEGTNVRENGGFIGVR